MTYETGNPASILKPRIVVIEDAKCGVRRLLHEIQRLLLSEVRGKGTAPNRSRIRASTQ